MDHFDARFFSELAELNDARLYCSDGSGLIPLDHLPSDKELLVSRMLAKKQLSNEFANLTSRFASLLAFRSKRRFVLERDFHVKPYQVHTHSKGRSGRKQLHVGFDAIPPGRLVSLDRGVSIGMGFDLHVDDVISPECAAEFEEFWMKVSDEPELFDATFGGLEGYAEPLDGFSGKVNAEVALQSIPNIMQPWLFYGRRMGMDEVLKLGTLENFVDECIRIFDKICEAGFHD
jgi:hypothetical protein